MEVGVEGQPSQVEVGVEGQDSSGPASKAGEVSRGRLHGRAPSQWSYWCFATDATWGRWRPRECLRAGPGPQTRVGAAWAGDEEASPRGSPVLPEGPQGAAGSGRACGRVGVGAHLFPPLRLTENMRRLSKYPAWT